MLPRSVTHAWTLLFAPGAVAHFGHGLGVNDVVEIVFGSGRPVQVEPQAVDFDRHAELLVTGFYRGDRVGTVAIRLATDEDLDQSGAFTVDDSRSNLPPPQTLINGLYIPLTVWPVSGEQREYFMAYVQRQNKKVREQVPRRQSGVPIFQSDAEAAVWYYAHRHERRAPVKLSPEEIRWLFGDVDPGALEDIVQ